MDRRRRIGANVLLRCLRQYSRSPGSNWSAAMALEATRGSGLRDMARRAVVISCSGAFHACTNWYRPKMNFATSAPRSKSPAMGGGAGPGACGGSCARICCPRPRPPPLPLPLPLPLAPVAPRPAGGLARPRSCTPLRPDVGVLCWLLCSGAGDGGAGMCTSGRV